MLCHVKGGMSIDFLFFGVFYKKWISLSECDCSIIIMVMVLRVLYCQRVVYRFGHDS